MVLRRMLVYHFAAMNALNWITRNQAQESLFQGFTIAIRLEVNFLYRLQSILGERLWYFVK